MNTTISINFGKPQHGWLPVNFSYGEFRLDLDASDVLNDPVVELYDSLIRLSKGKTGQITWWLEPFTYFFHFERAHETYRLTISEANDIEAEREVIKVITGNYKQMIEPFKKALLDFCSFTYNEHDWPYSIDKNKLQQLKESK